MRPPNILSDLPILVFLDIRKFRTLRRKRRCEVAYSTVCIWNWAIGRDLIGVMPVSAWRIVTFKYMNIVVCLRELPIGNKPTGDLNELNSVRIAIGRTLALPR